MNSKRFCIFPEILVVEWDFSCKTWEDLHKITGVNFQRKIVFVHENIGENICIRLVIVFVPPKMTPAETKSTRGKYGASLNSFHSNDSYENLNGSIIKLAKAKCLSYFIKHILKKCCLYMCKVFISEVMDTC